ncbi:hypothetical protein HK104_009861 [Borealophlyctis nickersoniae]|nr:hypothetical protein HK104_009861 [Borealophlyctis nickersoniae]
MRTKKEGATSNWMVVKGGGKGTRGRRRVIDRGAKRWTSAASRVPFEILLEILHLVPPQERRQTRYSCTLVSKLWHDVAIATIWEILDINLASDASLFIFTRKNGGKASYTRTIRLSHYWNVDETIFNNVRQAWNLIPEIFPNLRALDFGCIKLDVSTLLLAQIFDKCPYLISLAVRNWTGDIEHPQMQDSLAAGFARLEHFASWGNLDWSRLPLVALAIGSFGPNLRACTFATHLAVSSDTFLPLASQCKNLQHLNIPWHGNVAPIVASSPNLVQLCCPFSRNVVDAIVKHCPNLRSLYLCPVDNAGADMTYFATHGPKSLKSFGLRPSMAGSLNVNWDSVFRRLGHTLEHVDLTCFFLDSEEERAIRALMLYAKGLRTVRLNQPSRRLILALALACTKLEKVVVEQTFPKGFKDKAKRQGIKIVDICITDGVMEVCEGTSRRWTGLEEDDERNRVVAVVRKEWQRSENLDDEDDEDW